MLATLTLAILLAVNQRVAKSGWQPFFHNLKIIEQFSVTAQQPEQLNNTGISEFDLLNDVVTGPTRQIISDLQDQKQFSEDVSHELQTPLGTVQKICDLNHLTIEYFSNDNFHCFKLQI